MRTAFAQCGRTIRLVAVICGLFAAAALGDPVKTGGKGVKIPFSNYLDGDELHITTTGTASGKGPPPVINEHVVTVMLSNIKNGSFTVPAQDKDAGGHPINVRDYEIQVIHGGPDSYKSILDVESFMPDGTDLHQNSVGDELFDRLGEGVPLRLPILSADDGTFLYAMVNIQVFIPADVHFDIGQKFTIAADGTSSALPGMMFGRSQVQLDPLASDGFFNPDPFSGLLTVAAENDPSAVTLPLPNVAWAGAALMAGMGALRLRRRDFKGLARI